MDDRRKDFAPLEHVWLNAASEGPLPLVAAASLKESIEWKSKPYLLDLGKFSSTQNGLKDSIGRLIGVPARDVILGNSASYGLHLLADGIPWKKGDEIIVMHNDFPADILPWLALQKQGVKINQIVARQNVIEPEEFIEHLSSRTKALCISHVHTFTGFILDIPRFAQICNEKGIIFILNITQSVGTMPVDISKFPVDAVVAAGYKWLCGPYGVGFCWIKPGLRDRMVNNRAYWPAVLTEEDLKSDKALTLSDIISARKFDIFGTANFFNFVPFKSAIDYWLDLGLDNVRAYHDRLIDRFISTLDQNHYDLVSPEGGSRRSSLIVFSHRQRNQNPKIHKDLIDNGFYTAFWKGNVRIAAHVYNTIDQMDQISRFLNEWPK